MNSPRPQNRKLRKFLASWAKKTLAFSKIFILSCPQMVFWICEAEFCWKNKYTHFLFLNQALCEFPQNLEISSFNMLRLTILFRFPLILRFHSYFQIGISKFPLEAIENDIKKILFETQNSDAPSLQFSPK